MARRAHHVVMRDTTPDDVNRLRYTSFLCEHCGDVYVFALPVNVSVFVAASKAYERAHRGCKPAWDRPLPFPAGVRFLWSPTR